MAFSVRTGNKKERIILRDYFEYMLMLIIFLFGQSIYIRMIDSDMRYVYFDIAAVIVTIILLLFDHVFYMIDLLKAITLVLVLLVYLILTRIGQRTIIFYMCLPLFFFTLYCSNQWRKGRMALLLKKFADITVFFAFLSVVLYVLGTCLQMLPASIDSYSWAGTTRWATNYFHLMYETQTQNFFGIEFIRNSGIFCEAPSYAVPLLLSLFYELFIPGKLSKFRIGVILSAIVTSFSTKALIIALVAIGLKLFLYTYSKEAARNSNIRGLFKLFMPVILVAIAVVGFAIFDQKTDSTSYLIRMDNVNACVRAFMSHKLLGVGVANEIGLANYVTIYLDWQGFAMGLPVLLGQGGIYLTSFYAFAFIHAIRNIGVKSTMFCFEIILILIMFTSNIPYFLSVIFILAMQYSVPPKDNGGIR